MSEEFSSGEVEVSVYTDIGNWDGKTEAIKWELGLEMRDWGVKGISCYVPDQTIVITVEEDDQDGDSVTVEKTIEITSVQTEKSIGENTPDQIDLVELSLYKGKWIATFAF